MGDRVPQTPRYQFGFYKGQLIELKLEAWEPMPPGFTPVIGSPPSPTPRGGIFPKPITPITIPELPNIPEPPLPRFLPSSTVWGDLPEGPPVITKPPPDKGPGKGPVAPTPIGRLPFGPLPIGVGSIPQYDENGIKIKPPPEVFRVNPDGSYSITNPRVRQ